MKVFKKLMAVALVAVMAISLFTACGVSKDDMKDALKDKTKLSYNSDLESNQGFKDVKKVLDDFKRTEKKSDMKDELETAVSKANGTATDNIILYAVDGNQDDLAKDINTQIKSLKEKTDLTYNTFACAVHNGNTSSGNAVIVIVSTASK